MALVRIPGLLITKELNKSLIRSKKRNDTMN